MDQDAFRSLMWRHGLQAVGSRACTQVGGYPVTCRAKAGRIQVIFGTAQRFKELAPALHKAAAGLSVMPVVLEDSPGFVLPIREFSRFDEAAPAFAAALRTAGAAACDECPVCRKTGCDVVMMHQGLYQPMHDACADEALRRKKGPQ